MIAKLNNQKIKAIGKRTINLALPVAGTNFLNVFSTFIGVLFLAKLGQDVLAASALIMSVLVFGTIVLGSWLFSLGVIVSHQNGAKEYTHIGETYREGLLLATLLSIPIIIAFWNIKPILIFLNQKPILADINQTFFKPYCFAVFPIMWRFCNQQMAVAVYKQKLVLLSSIIITLILIPLAYGLMFGRFGLPKLGVSGLGIAYVIQSWMGFFILISCFYWQKDFKPYELFKFKLSKRLQHLRKLFSIGWPIFVQTGTEILAITTITIFIGWIGVKALAAFQVVSQLNVLFIVPIFGIVQASSILVAQAIGAKNYHEVNMIGYCNIVLGLFIIIIVMGFYIFAPRFLASWYINIHDPNNTALLNLIIIIFFINAFTRFFDAIRNIFIGALRGFYDTRYPMYMSIIVLWVIALPLGYFLGFYTHMGVIGLLIGFLAGMALGAVLMWMRWYSKCKQLK